MDWTNVFLNVFSILATLLASSGFWFFMDRRLTKREQDRKLLLGLTSFGIVNLGLFYIERGYILQAEFETLHELYAPYIDLGGNGSVLRLMDEIKKLPIKRNVLNEKNIMTFEGEVKDDPK